MKELLLDMIVDDFYALEMWRIERGVYTWEACFNSVSMHLHVEFLIMEDRTS